VQALKKRPTTLHYSGFWAIFAAKSAVAQRSGTKSVLTLQNNLPKKSTATLCFLGQKHSGPLLDHLTTKLHIVGSNHSQISSTQVLKSNHAQSISKQPMLLQLP
jgi:hypothetical protein